MSKQNSNIDFKKIISCFSISGTAIEIKPTGDGHINDTFLVKTKESDTPDYILQRINHSIFKDVPRLMENMQRVILHLKQKSNSDNLDHSTKRAVALVLTKDGKPYHFDSRGNYWRCFEYCENHSKAANEISTKQAFEGGKILGSFQAQLLDLPGGKLYDTIPEFHNLANRMAAFEGAIEKDCTGRLSVAKIEVDKMLARKDEMLDFDQKARDGSIPWRVTHNDTKFNNILFDENEEALCIIDLDTVMNGTVLYDFGDALRTLANTAEEDETDLTQVGFDIELYEAFSTGYLAEAGVFLTDIEFKYLAFSARFMTYIIGLRFLTDYLAGDVYFKTTRPEHNLERAKNQIKLIESIEGNFERMEAIIRDIR